MKSKTYAFIGVVVLGLALVSCKKTTTQEQDSSYVVPTSYSFENVNYEGQKIRLTMLDSISSYMSLGNLGQELSADILKNRYANINNAFGISLLDESGKQLKNKTFSEDQAYFDQLFDSLAVLSKQGKETASNGKAGVEGGRLFNSKGVELAQVIKKQLMGAVFYYQAMESYLGKLSSDDNATVVQGEGTAMQHHVDEAFGYFGAPIDYLTSTNDDSFRYWSAYANEVDKAISCKTKLMQAFIKLRASVNSKDYTTRDEQVTIIREQWERIVAASAILELTEGKEAFGKDAVEMRHVLSEAIGFIKSLKYSSTKKITNQQIENVLATLGSNFYEISILDINNTIKAINDIYSFDLTAF